MISIVPDIIDKKSSDSISDISNGMHTNFNRPIIKEVAEKYNKKIGGLVLGPPSYWRVERKRQGHNWHFDGCKKVDGQFIDNHMSWCDYGTSILLSPPNEFEGGELEYKNEKGEIITVDKKSHYLSGYIYTGNGNAPLEHRVTGHTGNRKVLLMFFKSKKSD